MFKICATCPNRILRIAGIATLLDSGSMGEYEYRRCWMVSFTPLISSTSNKPFSMSIASVKFLFSFQNHAWVSKYSKFKTKTETKRLTCSG